MCSEEIVALLCCDILHNVSGAEASGIFYFTDKDQWLFPVLKTKVKQMQRSSVFILTMQELHYIFATTSGHYLSTCLFFYHSFELPTFAYRDISKSVNRLSSCSISLNRVLGHFIIQHYKSSECTHLLSSHIWGNFNSLSIEKKKKENLP